MRPRKAPTLRGVVNMVNSASPRKVPKRPRDSTTSTALRPIASNGRKTSGSGGAVMPMVETAEAPSCGAVPRRRPPSCSAVPIHAQRPEGEVLRVVVVLEEEHARKPRAVPARVHPRPVGALAVEQVGDAALHGPTSRHPGREQAEEGPRRLTRD